MSAVNPCLNVAAKICNKIRLKL